MKEISARDLKQRLDRGEDIQIIDVREPNEYEVAHLENSKLIPHGEIGSRVSEIDPARETIVYCQKGGWRSAEAIAALQRAGFDRVLNLKGGISAWSDEVDRACQSSADE